MSTLSKSTSRDEAAAGEFIPVKWPATETFSLGIIIAGWPAKTGNQILGKTGKLLRKVLDPRGMKQRVRQAVSFDHWLVKPFGGRHQELDEANNALRALTASLNLEIECRKNRERELDDLNKTLELRCLTMTQEAHTAAEQFELALKNSNISVFHHDMLHKCIWSHNCVLGPEMVIGKADDEILPGSSADVLLTLKKNALTVPKMHEGEICINTDHGELWCLIRVVARKDVNGNIIGTTSISLDITERKHWEKHLLMLMREVNHRSRNLLAVLSSISSCTAAGATSVQDYKDKFGKRLLSLAKAHSIVAQDQWTASSLRSLIEVQIGAHQQVGVDRIRAKGPEILLKPKAMQNLGLALHELLTNSAKYGALSAPEGWVDLRWRSSMRNGVNVVQMFWREIGGPEVVEPKQKGFGSMLLDRVVGAELDGRSITKYRRSGVVWQTEFGKVYFVNPGESPSECQDTQFGREAALRRQYDQLIAAE